MYFHMNRIHTNTHTDRQRERERNRFPILSSKFVFPALLTSLLYASLYFQPNKGDNVGLIFDGI